MRTNTTKAKLKAGEAVFGCFVRYPEGSLVEVVGYQGWDFIVFDGEHGPIDPEACEDMVRAAELRDVTPIVRVTTNQPPVILRFMDTGAHGLHVPWVNSAAEAEAAVRSVKYGPRGMRGLAGVRASGFGQTLSLAEYTQRANAETLVVIHIETIDAVDELADIAAVDGVDVIFLGPTDLSHSLGLPGQFDHPRVQAAMERIVATVSESDAALGTFVGNAAAAQEWLERGARYIATGMEALLGPAMRDYLRTVRA